jgi:DNA-binding CsgD family transcriptional regulator
MGTGLLSANYELLEREAAFSHLEQLFDGLGLGEGGVVLVESAAGSGKTALLAAAAEQARSSGTRVLEASGGELERDFGFGIARQLLERVVREAPVAIKQAILDGPAQYAAQLLGEHAQAVPDPSSAQALVHGLYWVVLSLCGSEPVLLVVDDVQWADDASWEWLRYIARRAGGSGFGLLVAGRSGGGSGSEHQASEIGLLADTQVVRLEPLSDAGVGRLLEARLEEAPEPGFAGYCRELTQGNPFFVVELAHEIRANQIRPITENVAQVERLAPDRIGWSVKARLRRLGPQVGATAEALAVLTRASLSEISQLTGIGIREAAEALDRLVAHELVDGNGEFRFIHPVVRRTVYEDIAPAKRTVMHRAAARLIASEGGSPERIASHLLKVPPGADEWTADRLLRAAEKASTDKAFSAVVSYLARAAEEHVPVSLKSEILGQLGLAEATLRLPQSVDHLSQAIDLTADVERRVRLARALGRAVAFEGRVETAVTILEDEIERLGDDWPDLAWDLEMEIQGFGRTAPETFDRTNDRLIRLVVAAQSDPAFDRRLDHILVQRACWEGSDYKESEQRATESIRARPNPFASDPEWIGQYFTVQALGWCDRYEQALLQLELAFEAAALHGSTTAHVLASAYRADIHLRRGAFAEAEADARAAIELIDEHRLQVPAALAFSYLVTALVERGKGPEALAVLCEHGLDEEIPEQNVFALLFAARAHVHLSQGRPDQALEDALHAGELLAPLGPGPAPCGWRSTAALAAHAAGDRARAAELAEEDLRIARRFGAPRTLGIALRTAALVTEGDSVSLLRESVEVLEPSEAAAELARSWLELGAVMRRERYPVRETRPLLQKALDLAHRTGASLVEQRARDELVAAGGRPRRASTRGVDALTPRELRVAELAAAGSTNRQIAQVLFVTPRTVEHHLSSVYRKLAIASREDLGQALARPAPEVIPET